MSVATSYVPSTATNIQLNLLGQATPSQIAEAIKQIYQNAITQLSPDDPDIQSYREIVEKIQLLLPSNQEEQRLITQRLSLTEAELKQASSIAANPTPICYLKQEGDQKVKEALHAAALPENDFNLEASNEKTATALQRAYKQFPNELFAMLDVGGFAGSPSMPEEPLSKKHIPKNFKELYKIESPEKRLLALRAALIDIFKSYAEPISNKLGRITSPKYLKNVLELIQIRRKVDEILKQRIISKESTFGDGDFLEIVLHTWNLDQHLYTVNDVMCFITSPEIRLLTASDLIQTLLPVENDHSKQITCEDRIKMVHTAIDIANHISGLPLNWRMRLRLNIMYSIANNTPNNDFARVAWAAIKAIYPPEESTACLQTALTHIRTKEIPQSDEVTCMQTALKKLDSCCIIL